MSNSSEEDNDDFTQNLYKHRGRSDSLGKDSSTGGNLYGGNHSQMHDSPSGGGGNEEDEAYQPKERRDTFHLRRGTVDSANDDSYGGYNYRNASPMGSAIMQSGRDRDRHDSNSSDGDGGGYGMRNERIWSEATSGGGADFRYGHGGSESARRISSH